MCEALVVLEKHGIIHQNITPRNIFITVNFSFKLGFIYFIYLFIYLIYPKDYVISRLSESENITAMYERLNYYFINIY
jgi:CBS domain containing-hemolysin-like protein